MHADVLASGSTRGAVILTLFGLWIAGCGASPPAGAASRSARTGMDGFTARRAPPRSEALRAAAKGGQDSKVQGAYRFELFNGSEDAFSTTVFGLNNPGLAVGNHFDIDQNRHRSLHGLLRTRSSIQTVDVPFAGAIGTDWRAVNDRGMVIGGWADSDGFVHGAIRDAHGNITRFDYPGDAETFPGGINNQGEIVGSHDPGDFSGAGFLFRRGQFIDLPDVPQAPGQNYPAAINDPGLIVGNYLDDSFLSHGYVLRNGQYTTFDFPGSIYTSVNSLNDQGQAAGFTILEDFTEEGFIYDTRTGGFQTISCPDAAFTDAYAINDQGQIGGICGSAPPFPAFVATPDQSAASSLGEKN